MLALMMDRPLTLPSILEHAAAYHGDREVVSRSVEGRFIHRYGDRDALARSKQMAKALLALGVQRGDRAATWPGAHTGTSSSISRSPASGRCYTPSTRACTTTRSSGWPTTPRTACCCSTSPSRTRSPQLAPRMTTVKTLVAMTDAAHAPPGVLVYEDLLAAQTPDFDWPEHRRKERVRPLLHLRHHRQSQGGALRPSLDGAARPGAGAAGRLRSFGPRRGDALRPDVPRQRLVHAVRGAAGGGQAGAAGTVSGRPQCLRADRRRGRLVPAGRAHHLGRRRRPPGPDRRSADLRAHHRGRWLGAHCGADLANRGPPGRPGAPDLGHDRDLAAGRDQHPTPGACGRGRRRHPASAS